MRRLHSPLILTSSESLLFYIPYFDRKGIRWKEVADEFRLPSENLRSETWIPMRDFSLFLSKMATLCDDEMPLIVGQNTAQSVIDGRWGLIKQGTDFKRILQSLMTNEHRFSRQNSYWLEKVTGAWSWCHRGALKPSYPGANINEWFRVALLLHLCRNWLGREWQPSRLNVMTEERQGRIFADILLPQTNVLYGQPFLSLELTDVEDLEPMTSRSLKSRDIGEILLLAESYSHLPQFTMDWIASLFGVTTKTLYRYFKDHNTSFKEIKKNAVLKRSIQLLTETNEPVSTIAYQMGYDDVSNYNRAIKSISGFTPAQLRKSELLEF
ncbi:helix-turn-helix transcriptional regulator [Vibrio sp. 10N.261.55.A7]|uniref:helix-turn-helix domain-containing protein n=1 Tax=Vibrio sp. 10N.261.55.A7 TaxID=1880851 RepID=UPI000C820201|nr:helix-turn-helix transcriptional regulator [Vibrio sp. 10N.261.55.A7]PMK02272.1 hypothetical protein BCU12_18565 [Vibrio sp. 10N.261.55.A7]